MHLDAKLADVPVPPLVVDLDGTLVQTDLLVESLFAYVGGHPIRLLSLASAFSRGRAPLKAEIARLAALNPAQLPYDERVLSLIREARGKGGEIFLASASNERLVRDVAGHLGLFRGWFASTDSENLSSSMRAKRLVEVFGEKGFDYVGNDRADLSVWSSANRCLAVGPSPSVRRALKAVDANALVLEPRSGGFRRWIELLRVHQWTKNALVFVPIFAAHRFDLGSMVVATVAAFAFSLAASSGYIFNDLVDLDADRRHWRKKSRPAAAGTVSARQAIVLALALLCGAIAVGLIISPAFAAVVLAYLALSAAYTLYLKRKMMADIIALSSLHILRVIAGAVAIGVRPSEWILAFSMFIFTALALIKRYVELAARLDAGLPDPTNRNYRTSDLNALAALAAASGFNAVTVFALYVYSDTVHRLYRHPDVLWLICPILMYWVGRALIMADRRLMDEDPIEFALKDWNSLLCAALIGFIMIAAA
jgi:4-hydroxybenzoate polyprenyltransferase/phosphoserine phosphatase